ncbi:transglycosylase domain-containing protein [Streptomyces johnsoniae]|uniref:Transglycosylase domain-containing protein n=1 Tax=Streptomyces johnsoniae TaxID=3075532 RepID=A0ABU2SCD5_9ACTN|nr:transglycosylase domain-containing protein [Streptomyces sp. DSM 41886]MDT0445365.1 transglycosylase domain-containing protein [Streptomyces sp. DSM 41886]
MSRKRPGGGLSATQQVAKFLGVSVLSGAVLAGLALPAVGAFGLAARGTMEGFDEIPAMMERPPLSQKTTILDAEGNRIADVYSRNRTVIELDEMSEYLPQALIAIEDARFYEHGAVDLRGIMRALTTNVESGGVEQGASTLTQQYVKNVFVEAAGDDPEAVAEATIQSGAAGLGRKIREMKYAIQLEQELTKDQILENYLNITYFGQQAYGAEAAAQRYFSKPAADLALHEAALLAGLVQSPSQYDPVNDDQAALQRRNTVLQSMVVTGDITQAEADEAKALDLGLNVSQPRNGCITAVNDAGFFCDYVKHEFLANPVFGETREDREALWALGGLTIQTSLDPQAQEAAAQAARDGAFADDSVSATVVAVEPGTGHILSMAQSRPYGNDPEQHQTTINLNVSQEMGGSNYGFQPGSTFKPITAAAALEGGISPAREFTTDNELTVPKADFRNCEGQPLTDEAEPNYELGNERDDMEGTWDMTEALADSVNTYFVELEREAGLCETMRTAAEMGVERGDNEPLAAVPSLTLGSETIAPLQIANVYATFAARGMYCAPAAITAVTDAEGEELPVPEPECERAISERNADLINAMLRNVVDNGTGSSVAIPGRQVAGKTGTTNDRRDVWFAGHTPEVATAVHVGNENENQAMVDINIAGQFYEQAGGASVAGPIWRQAMTGALADVPPSTFAPVEVPRGDDDDDDRGDDDRPGDNRPGDGGGNGGNGGGGNGNGGGGDGGDNDGDNGGGGRPDIDLPGFPPDIFNPDGGGGRGD